ncbi:MAG: aminopeptidase P family protein, partial [Paracoccaceae bacterium]
MQRPEFFRFHNGEKAILPFSQAEYDARLMGLRAIMDAQGLDAVVLSSMHNIAYYSGFLYCAFGRPYALVVTASEAVVISAGIDAGQPWRRCACDGITYTDWQRNNYWRAVAHVAGQGKAVGYEADHLVLSQFALLNEFLAPKSTADVAAATMRQRMVKSVAERELIRAGAQVADVGGYAIRDAVKAGVREI